MVLFRMKNIGDNIYERYEGFVMLNKISNKSVEEIIFYLENHGMIDDEVKDTCIYALEKVEKYEALERQLVQVYGECDDLLEEVVKGLVRYEKAPSENVDKSSLLTNEDADRWEKYKQIMEELPITIKKVCIDGEYIWVVKNEDINKMSTGFTKKQAIDKYMSGKTFDAEEWEKEQEDFSL